MTIGVIVFDDVDIDPSVSCARCGELGRFGLGLQATDGRMINPQLACAEHLAPITLDLHADEEVTS